MRYILDTNIIFSGIYNIDSNAGKILLLGIEEKIEILSPYHVKMELEKNLLEKLQFSDSEMDEIISSLFINWIEDEIYRDYLETASKMISDEKDVPVLACALALECDIISGDKHFHDVVTDKIKIWRLKQAIEDLEH